MNLRRSSLALLVCITSLVSCGDADRFITPLPIGGVAGFIYSTDSTPLPDIPVSVLDGESFVLVAGPVRTNSTGYYEIRGVRPGQYFVHALSDIHWLFNRTDPVVEVNSWGLSRHDMWLGEAGYGSASSYQIEGVVRDAETGAPIERALVSTFSLEQEPFFLGVTGYGEGITDSSGRFFIASAVVQIANDGEVLGLAAILADKEGYLPSTSGLLPIPGSPDSTVTYDFELSSATAGGRIHGRVLFEGQPIAGIAVGLNLLELFGEYSHPSKQVGPVLGSNTRTNPLGEYEFTGLPSGAYFVDPAPLPNDGYLSIRNSEWVILSVDETEAVDDLEIVRAIVPLEPIAGSELNQLPDRLTWSSYSEALSYRVSISNQEGWIGSWETTDTTLTPFPIPEPSHGVRYRWDVWALRGRTIVNKFEEAPTFTVAPGSSESSKSLSGIPNR